MKLSYNHHIYGVFITLCITDNLSDIGYYGILFVYRFMAASLISFIFTGCLNYILIGLQFLYCYDKLM